MDLMKAAIMDKRKGMDAGKKRGWKKDDASSDEEEVAPKKYMKRGELRKMRGEESSDEEEVAVKKAVEVAATEAKKAEEEEEEEDDEYSNMYQEDAMRRLRSYGKPVTLFGESSKDRMKRLKEFELEQLEKHGGSMGTGHEIQAILASEVENEIVNATLAAMESDQRGDTEESRKEKARRERKMNKRHNKYLEMKPREDFKTVEDYITFFFKRILLLWEEELNARPDEEKKSGKGKVASATQKQTRSYLSTLFSELKKKTCPKDVVNNTDKIVNNCIIREYVKANEAYLMMAIGNAAWPMGVTMVGIHERAGRERIFSGNVGHVLNNEKSRKYIQGMKRIMTFCQHAFPNVPSKMVI
jgi:pre-mRNA-splicing factor 18